MLLGDKLTSIWTSPNTNNPDNGGPIATNVTSPNQQNGKLVPETGLPGGMTDASSQSSGNVLNPVNRYTVSLTYWFPCSPN